MRYLPALAAALLAACRTTPPPPRAVAPDYVEAATCAGCHAEIWKTYRQTGMGRSFYKPRLDQVPGDGSYHHKPSERYYTMTERDGALYQRRHQLGPRGEVINEFEKRVDFVLGSGNHSRTYLYRGAEGKLYQLPVAWYSANGGYWAMNPGYDRPNHQDFRRTISYDCMFCHNGYPRPAPAAPAGADPVFPGKLPEGIDCQRCHGPGSLHAQGSKEAILNPKRLSRQRQLELCMQCHLETSSRPLPYSIVRYDREVFSYRPDQPLASYILHFDRAETDDRFEIAHAAYRLRKSACFSRSETMTCTTCHDPHGARKIDYKAVCQSCHPSAHNAKQDCANCHMPKRRTDDVVHVVMTDHFIQRRKPARNLLAPLKEQPETEATAYRGEVAPYYPPAATDELYLAVAQVTERSNLKAGIPRLESAISKQKPAEARFYFELAEAYWKSGETAKALPWYEEALRRKPDDRASLRNYGAALRRHGDLSKAASVLERAGDDAAALTTLGDVYLSLGRVDDAERVLRRAAAIDPDSPEANNNLGQALARKGDPDSAINALRNAIRVRPDYAAAHNSLANLLADFGEARRHFELAIRFDPLYAEAHYNYGTALAQRKQWREAERHLIEAARIQPSFAEAYNNLGNVYAAQGADAKAAAAFAQAVQARPDFGEARLNLAVALANTGRISQAKEELTKAAQSADPQVRERALHGLEALGR